MVTETKVDRAVVPDELIFRSGAQFWVQISTLNDTFKQITKWRLELRHESGKWTGDINSFAPTVIPHASNLSGTFLLKVFAGGPHVPYRQLTPLEGSDPHIVCGHGSASMVGIRASADGKNAHYWTAASAFCALQGAGIEPRTVAGRPSGARSVIH